MIAYLELCIVWHVEKTHILNVSSFLLFHVSGHTLFWNMTLSSLDVSVNYLTQVGFIMGGAMQKF